MVARWESGTRVPSVRTLVKVAQATGYELAVGLREPMKRPDRFLALEVIERKGQKTRGRILREAAARLGTGNTGAQGLLVARRRRPRCVLTVTVTGATRKSAPGSPVSLREMSSALQTVFSPGALRHMADGPSFERGAAYVDAGRVKNLKIGDDEASASVRGTHQYRVRLWLERGAPEFRRAG